MPRKHEPVVRRRFVPDEAMQIEGEEDWNKIFDLPWDDEELKILELVEGKGDCTLENSEVEQLGYEHARDVSARLNNMFRCHNLDYRFTNAHLKKNYWGQQKLLKF